MTEQHGDRYLAREGARIAYEVTGTRAGPPVGYAHGVMLSRAAVRRLELLDLDAMAGGRRLLTYDARGHGRSTGRPVTEDYLFGNYARDLLALLDEAGFEEPMDFTGSSLGADTALRAALLAPERFRRLVVMIPPVAWESGEGPHARDWYTAAADTIEAHGAAHWREGWAKEADTEVMPLFDGYPRFDMTPDISDELLPHALRGVAASDLPSPEEIATVRQPTLVLAWDADPLHPVSTAERLHGLLPDAELHVSRSVADVQGWTRRIAEFLEK
ncbi:alpha/beta fold hydrolase [Streptomyces sp. NPDC048172]|uniref:alpha/beta fold hydrolase n=1 Tax=Streptomyces sp. NPDC048172 TaxID=3365505 RepID=UPI00371CF6CA